MARSSMHDAKALRVLILFSFSLVTAAVRPFGGAATQLRLYPASEQVRSYSADEFATIGTQDLFQIRI